MSGMVYCMFLYQDALVLSGARTSSLVLYFCVSCIQVPLAVSGAWSVFCVTHAVCFCIKVPLAVSGGRIHGRCGLLYVLASKCL